MTKPGTADGRTRRAWRVTFDYDGDEISVRRSELIDKRVPPSDELLREGETASRSGFWVELTDEGHRTVWRRVLDDPREASLEAPAGDRPGALTRASVERPTGSFRLLLPERDDGRYLAVVASPFTPRSRAGRARVVARFDLRTGERVGPDPTQEPPKRPKRSGDPRRPGKER
jgi:hypothetical protein